ncbi:hypothetical protein GCM10022267_27800 [Lentzea roselyniae]|uniref:Ricin B lectin domain-containing protein n=2 Tax=Lentzea roselyniae TaxID=531940 RepID=A0ABP7ASY0_9PSEU
MNTKVAADSNNPDRLGGKRVFDGAQSEDIAALGYHGMVYLHDKVKTENSCQKMQENANWKNDVKRFRNDKRLNPVFRSAVGKLKSDERPFAVFPNQTITHTTEHAKTETWQRSASLTLTVEFDFEVVKTSVAATYSTSYQKEISVAKGKQIDAPNKTANKVIYYQYGIAYDVFSVQETPWRAEWHLTGEKIMVGDDATAIARWYTVPEDGCYRSAVFSSISLPSAETLMPVAQMPFTPGQTTAPPIEEACPMSISGEDVYPYHWVNVDDDRYLLPDAYDEESEEEKKPFENGKCVLRSASNGVHEEDGTVFYEISEQDSEGGYYFVDARDVKFNSPAAEKSRPLPGWQTGTAFRLQPVTAKDLAVGAKGGGVYSLLTEAKDDSAKWRAETSAEAPGKWRFFSVAVSDACLEVGSRRQAVFEGGCSADNTEPQFFRPVLTGDGRFYLHSTAFLEACITIAEPTAGAGVVVRNCVKDRDTTEFEDPKFLWELTPA